MSIGRVPGGVDMRLDLHGLLFGDVLAVSRADWAIVRGGGAVALGVFVGPSIVVTALALFLVTRIRRPRPAGSAAR